VSTKGLRTMSRRAMILDSADEARMLLIDAHEALEQASVNSRSLPVAVRCGEVAGRIARFFREERKP
jgi:hypothetical protein